MPVVLVQRSALPPSTAASIPSTECTCRICIYTVICIDKQMYSVIHIHLALRVDGLGLRIEG